MPRVYVLSGRSVGRSFDVSEGDVVGRAGECEIALSEPSISRRHARFELRRGRWFVVDLGSTNGVRHDGERVRAAPLEDLDEFQLGQVELRFRSDAPTPAGARDDRPSEGEVVLEEEVDLSPRAQPRKRPAPRSALETASLARAGGGPPAERNAARGPALGGDLEQRPWWIQTLVWTAALALALLAAYGAFSVVVRLRSG